MTYDTCCGSGQYDALAKDVLKNSEDVFQVKQDEAEQNARLDVAEQDIQSNTDAIQAISGSIEVKSFLTTRLNGVSIGLSAGVSTELTFTKQIESDPDVMSYDPILNVFKFSEGIVGLYTSAQFGQALTGLATNGTIRLIDIATGTPVAEDAFSIPQGSNNYVVYPQALIEFDAVQATKDYRVEIEVDRAIQLKEVRNIFEKSLSADLDETILSRGFINAETGKKYKVVAGVIRNNGSGWEQIGSEHAPINVLAVNNDNSIITITYNFTAKNVVSFIVTPDETLVGDYLVGASVGINITNLYLYEKSNVSGYITYNGAEWTVGNNSGNIIIDDVDFSTLGKLKLSHVSCEGLDISLTPRDGSCIPSSGGIGVNTSEIILYDFNGNLITTPSTALKIFFNRNGSKKVVNPNELVVAGGNLWFYGIFEI